MCLTLNVKNSKILIKYGLGSGCFRKEPIMENHVYEVMETANAYTGKDKRGKKEGIPKGEEFTYEIIEHIGVLKTSAAGWTKELNIISWNGNPQKYDIREWAEDHKKMSRGITLTASEAKDLFLWLGEQDFEESESEEE